MSIRTMAVVGVLIKEHTYHGAPKFVGSMLLKLIQHHCLFTVVISLGSLIAVVIILHRRVSFLGQPAALPVLPGAVLNCAV